MNDEELFGAAARELVRDMEIEDLYDTVAVLRGRLAEAESRAFALEANNARKTAALEEIAAADDVTQIFDRQDALIFYDLARTALSASDEQATLVTGNPDSSAVEENHD